ncbi:MAG: hypothetical protein QOF76_3746 [Solirubrobacteraceae bacterium]|nr:hypothetical protein [Solirubrobacteraceae bacterium]
MGTASYRSFADATRAVLDLLETQVPGAAVFLAHLDRGHEIHRIVDTRNGGEFGLRSNLALPLSDSFCVHMADDRAPRLCNDVAAHPIYGRVAAQSRFGAGAYLGTPLELSDGSRVGSLSAMSREPMVFRAEHEQLFGMLARVLAYELERETQERDVRRLNDSLRSQAHGMAAVERATRALSADADPRRAILQAACDAAGAPVAFLLEPKGRELVSTAMYGVEMAPVTIQAREESPRGVTTAFASLESYFVADARDHPALADPLVQATMARSALFEPVVREGAVSGVIIIVWRDAVSAPSESLNAVLRLLAAHAAAAIEHATLRDRLGELALSDPLTGLATERMFEVELPRELARARRAILEAACDAADAPVAFLLEPKGRELASTAMFGVEMAPVTIQAREESPRGVTTAFASLESYFVADAREHPALAEPLVLATMARSALFEPVVREGAVSGVIIIVWREAVSAPGESLNAVLRLIAAHAAAAIEHATLRDRLGELALSDPLTGLATERMFEVELPRELARARRSEAPVCIALFDLDALGAFNMLRGEREGDRLLKETGASWSGALRDVDLLARFDGGTFCALLPGCMLGEACEVVDRVRSLTPRLQTASAGVAEWNREEPAELLLGRARGAMASAKAAGRDITLPAD